MLKSQMVIREKKLLLNICGITKKDAEKVQRITIFGSDFTHPTYLAGWFGHGPSYWDNSRELNVLRSKTNGMIHQVEKTINNYNNHDSLCIYIHIHMYRCST
jgi:hypothetical protein